MNRRRFIPALALALTLAAAPAVSSALEIGDKAPDFMLPSTKGGKFQLSQETGKKNVVVQFYVLDFTPT
jgi:peroxiredoxin Q/BCP